MGFAAEVSLAASFGSQLARRVGGVVSSWGIFFSFSFVRRIDIGTDLKRKEKKTPFQSVFHLAWKDPADSHLEAKVEIKSRKGEERRGGMVALTVLPFS